MSDDEDYSDSFDTDNDETETTSVEANSNKVQEKCTESDMQATNLHALFGGTLVLIKIVEAYSIEHARDWRAPTNMLEMLQLVQKLCRTYPELREYIGKEKELSQIWATMAGVEDISIPHASTDNTSDAAAASTSNATSTTEAISFASSDRKVGATPPLPPSTQPKYVCVILHREADDHLLFESRGPDAVNAAGKLTCFGGKIETGETPLQAILRECHEEIGWAPRSSDLARCVDLYVDDRLIAYFYLAKAPSADVCLKFEEARGRHGVWLSCKDVPTPELSPWHACVLQAWQRGDTKAMFVTKT